MLSAMLDRILKNWTDRGDAAPMAIINWYNIINFVECYDDGILLFIV